MYALKTLEEKQVMNSSDSSKNPKIRISSNLDKSEHRYLPRWKVNNRIQFKTSQDPQLHEARSRDLSCAGACLVTEQPLAADQKIEMTIFLDERTAVEVHGKALWNRAYAAGNLAGIAFYNTTMEIQDLILQHAFEIRREDVVNQWFKGWEKK